ncbi:GAF domain-containing protein [Planktothrix pseudagardhii]|uniref:WD repeat-containing protein slr0143 n=1 Tax=Planktothrix pseudagardhii TaxID=132604 RepID=A0A9W4G257_9CYAN|nr:GAF domain-containing protein [Planktothrix pseudagardhii]CAD5922194.1 putative WD repeat-containing protein slr0143 [Planktothrix pseudagardhii]
MNYEYKVGGSLPPDSPTYVWRKADHELYHQLMGGMFCYVLTCRQMGKSSLRVKTMRKLQEQGLACASIDLTAIISSDLTRKQFYADIIDSLAENFNLLESIDSFKQGCRESDLSPMNRFNKFIHDILLKHPLLIEKNIIIFIDEIDSLLRLPDLANEFLGLLRACYNKRADLPEYNRLTFAILGVASPYDLMKDANYNSLPFDCGYGIELHGFQSHEAQPIAEGLKLKSEHPQALLDAVLDWTSGQPFLTQKICKLIVKCPDQIPLGSEAEWVEKFVRSQVINNWEHQDEPEHLRTIRDRLLRQKNRSIDLLKLYQKIREKGKILADNSLEQMELRLSGLVSKREGILEIRNRIYKEVFTSSWCQKALAELRDELAIIEPEFIQTLAKLKVQLLETQIRRVAEGSSSDEVIYEVLRQITLKLGDLLKADRATIYLLNAEKTELWSLVAENQTNEFLNIQVPVGEGIAGQAAKTKKIINIPHNVYDDPRSNLVKLADQKYGYHTYNVLAYPICNHAKEVVAVIQLLNKLKANLFESEPLAKRVKEEGFNQADEEQLTRFAPHIRRFLESCQSCRQASRKLQATAALAEATRSLDGSQLDTKEILQRVMDAAKNLMNADRSTLWLVDEEKQELWTKIRQMDGTLIEKRIHINEGFAGQVARTREPIIIPFDVYQHPDSQTSKETDLETGYRTCSLLCMPVLNPDGELLGVTQLVNKLNPGNYPDYNSALWPQAPEKFKASFDKNDRQSMQVFNERVGVILQYAKVHERLKKLAEFQSQKVVYHTLAMLSQAVGSQKDEELYSTLYNILEFMMQSISKLLRVAQTDIFIFNSDKQEFWSIIPDINNSNHLIEVIIEADVNLSQRLLNSNSSLVLNSISNLDDPWFQVGVRFHLREQLHNALFFPFINSDGQVIAVIRLLNKLIDSPVLNSEPINQEGFTPEDLQQLHKRSEFIIKVLEGCQSFHQEISTLQKQRATDTLRSAINSVRQIGFDPEKILYTVIESAKKLTNADRSTLWLVDAYDPDKLWTRIPRIDGTIETFYIYKNEGFAGKVSQMKKPIMIPFDVYDHPESQTAKGTDQETGYRTCSLLCMPILSFDGELLGVTQLLNKRKPGNYPPYHPKDIYDIPDYLKVSFDERDLRYMEIFNNQVGIDLPHVLNKT